MINSVNNTSSNNTDTKRVSGLASGMDTEQLVKDSTSMIRSRLYSAQQEKQLLEWKQENYREIVNNLNDFNNKYFGSSYSNILIGDSFNSLTAKSTSDYVSVVSDINAQRGNVYINDIVSLAVGAKAESSSSVSKVPTITVSTENLSSLSGKSLKISLDGMAKELTFSKTDYSTYSVHDIQAEFQGLVDNAFGAGRINVSDSGNVLSLNADTSKLIINRSSVESNDISDVFQFTDGASNRLGLGSPLSELPLSSPITDTVEFKINSKTFTFSKDQTLGNMISAINSSDAGATLSYSTITDTFTLTSKETGAASKISYEDVNGSFLNSILGDGKHTKGTDAVISVALDGSTDGTNLTTLTRSSNTFDINGSTYTLNGKAVGDEKEGIAVNVSYDTDEIVKKVVSFVDDYNKLTDSMTSKLDEKRYKDFLPLVDEDAKSKLTDSEINQWTEKAKSGLLKNDPTLLSITNSLRSSLYDSVKSLDGTGKTIDIILPDIGITTSSYQAHGKLKIDETKLRKFVTASPEKVLSLFTQKPSVGYSRFNTEENIKTRYEESGILWKINDIIKNNLSSVGKKGPLIEMVGSPTSNFLGKTTLSKQLNTIDNTIYTLKQKLSSKEKYYWSKYTSMETALSKLSATSSWLTGQLPS